MNTEIPYLSWTTIPAGTIKGMGEFKNLANANFVRGREDIPEEITYRMVKAICADMATEEAAFPAMKGLNIPWGHWNPPVQSPIQSRYILVQSGILGK